MQKNSRDRGWSPQDLGSFFHSVLWPTGRTLSFWPKVAAGVQVITSALQMVGGREIPCKSCLTAPLAAHQPELIRRPHLAARKARIRGLSAVPQCAQLDSGILLLKAGENGNWSRQLALLAMQPIVERTLSPNAMIDLPSLGTFCVCGSIK